MSKRKENTCLPLEFIKLYSKHPEIQQILAGLPDGADAPQEIDSSQIISRYIEINRSKEKDPKEQMNRFWLVGNNICNTAQVIYTWGKSKQIFSFDQDFWKLLTQKDYDQAIPVEILERVPYKAFFIEPINGFVYFERCFDDNGLILKLLRIDSNLNIISQSDIRCIPGKSIRECFDMTIELFYQMLDEAHMSEHFVYKHSDEAYKELYEALQAVLYICSQNADINENPEQKQIYRKPAKVKHQFKEVRKWDVGTTVIKSFKKSVPDSSSPKTYPQSSGGWTMRPHLRRAHWHHYWKGPQSDRQLVLRWIAPTFVNAELGDAPVAITKMK